MPQAKPSPGETDGLAAASAPEAETGCGMACGQVPATPAARRAADKRVACASMLLGPLHEKVQDQLLATSRVLTFDRGATVFLQGEDARAIYIVLDGWVKLYRITPSGTEAVVATFTRTRSFGEAVALRNASYPVSAEAATDCRLLRLNSSDVLSLIRERPDAAISMLSATFEHLHALVGQVEALKARNGAQRVAEFLLDLAECPDEGSCEVTLPYDKLLVAGRLGMKPESLSRAFAKLKPHGVTITRNAAFIEDVEALRVFVEEDPANSWSR
jgi:CRP-like cAMP-binding protein